MADNLNINIVADTKTARSELELLNAKMRATQKEIKATSDIAEKTGDPTQVAKVRTLTAAYDGMTKTHAGLRKEVNATTIAVRGFHNEAHPHKFRITENSLKSLNGAFLTLGHGIAGAKAGIAGFAIGMGIQQFIKQLEEASQRLRDIRELASGIGAKPLLVQSVQELAKEAGETIENANKFLTGLGATLQKVATKPRPAAGSPEAAAADRRAFDDRGVEVMRGSEKVVRDFSDALAILRVNEAALIKLPVEQQMKRVSDAFLLAVKNAKQLHLTEVQLNAISKDIFGVPTDDAIKLATAYSNVGAKQKELATAARGATKEHIEGVETVDSAYEKLSHEVQNTIGALLSSTEKLRIKIFESLAAFVKTSNEQASGTQPIEVNFVRAAKSIVRIWELLFKDLSLISKAHAAEVAPDGSKMTLPEVAVTARRPDLPTVFYGPGRGEYGGHGPPPPGLGYGGPDRQTQSHTPGIGDYQRPEPKVVHPIEESFGRLTDSSNAAAKAIADLASASASASAVNAWVDPSVTTGLASGGFIRGPGGPTSDSILARLSNGEFVMSAAAVSHWGPQMMAMLNGLQNPGFSGGSLPRFAEGGMVAAGGGTPVHLHLGSGSFALHGSSNVVDALVVEAHRQQMRSAGTKPSWFAARPSGH